MRILSIASSSIQGGATISLINTLLGLKKRGVEILVAVPTEGYLTNILKIHQIEYILCPIPFWAWPMEKRFYQYWKFIPKLIRLFIQEEKAYNIIKDRIKYWKPDLIHTNVSVVNLGYRLSKHLQIPHIWHIREYGDLDFNIRSIYGKKRFHRILNNSWTICITKALKKYYGLSEKCKVIYNGIEERKSDLTPTKKDKSIIFVGRLTREKGVDDVIENFIHFTKENDEYKLDLIGSCTAEYRSLLLQKIKMHGLQDRIRFLGHLRNPYKQMQNAKAIIVASKSEGFGRITAEAMLNGCLVIGRNTAGTKEQLDNGQKIIGEEIAIRYDDNVKLHQALHKLASLSDEEYEKIVENAKRVVRKLYSVENNVEATFKFIEYVLSKQNKNNTKDYD